MPHTSTPRSARSLAAPALALILAAAFQLLWSTAGAWVWTLRESLRNAEQIYERLVVRNDGTPLITREVYRNRRPLARREIRTLEGEPVERDASTHSPIFAAPLAPSAPFHLAWSQRLQAFAVPARPAEFWYFVHDGRRDGRGYFEGFGAETSHHLGYLGLSGLRPDRPPPEDRFPATPESMTMRAYGSWPYGHEPWQQLQQQRHGQRERPNYVVGPDRVWEVHLGRREVRVIWQGAGAVDIQPVTRLYPEVRESEEWEGRQHWAVRTVDRLHLLDIDKQPAYSVELPESARYLPLQAYEFPGGGLLLVAQDADRYAPRARVYWVRKEPGPEKSREVLLTPMEERIPPTYVWAGVGALLPGPLLLTVGGVVASVVEPAGGPSQSFEGALRENFAALSPTLLVLAVLGAALGVWTARRQSAYGRGNALGWAAFVFLLGPAGVAGYFWHRAWAVRGRCPSCSHVVPLDREACMSCGADFPRPERLSTEIHA